MPEPAPEARLRRRRRVRIKEEAEPPQNKCLALDILTAQRKAMPSSTIGVCLLWPLNAKTFPQVLLACAF